MAYTKTQGLFHLSFYDGCHRGCLVLETMVGTCGEIGKKDMASAFNQFTA